MGKASQNIQDEAKNSRQQMNIKITVNAVFLNLYEYCRFVPKGNIRFFLISFLWLNVMSKKISAFPFLIANKI